MCISISYENSKDLENALRFEQNAERLMKAEVEQKEVVPSAPAVIDLLREVMPRRFYKGQGLQ